MASLHIGVEETKDDYGPGENYPRHYHEVHRAAMGNQNHGSNNARESGALPHQFQSNPCDASDGVQGVFEIITKNIFGSCGSVVEAASFFVQNSFQRNTAPRQSTNGGPGPNFGSAAHACAGFGANPRADAYAARQQQRRRKIDPLSRIAGRYQSKALNPPEGNGNVNLGDVAAEEIPPYLAGETIAYSFDDNISALSAHTLEEMAKKGDYSPTKVDRPYLARPPPSPTRTSSTSSESQSSVQERTSERDVFRNNSSSSTLKKKSGASSQRLPGISM